MAEKNKPVEKGSSMRILRRVLAHATPFLPWIVLSIGLAIVCAILSLVLPILAGRAIDLIAGASELTEISGQLIRYAVIAVICALSQWGMNSAANRILFRIARDVRDEAMDELQHLPLSYLDTRSQGDIVSTLIADVDQFTDGLLMGFSQFFTGVVTIVGTLAFMFWLDAGIALVVVVLTPLSLLVARFIATRSFDLFKRQSAERARQTALIDEMVGNLEVVKAYGHEAQNMRDFDETGDALEDISVKATFISSLTNPGTRFVNNIVYACVALTGALRCITGSMSVGELTIFLSYANQYTRPFNEISGVVTEFQNALACAGRVFALIDEKREVADAEDAVAPQSIDGRIDIEDVDFSYVPERELIKGLSLKVSPGERIAIVGPTGSGKTTIINLLMRFYDVDSGSIALEGIDIRNMPRAALRAGYGMVLQETWLRRGSVRDNITLGREGFSDSQIEEAARAAHAHGFIRRLPQGYDTILDEEGGSLSQGQRQLLCIARVMLLLPPMLILDEATSSIDTMTEMRIQSAFQTMMRGRTSFIVAHRLSTIREADRILVLRDGHVVEQGTHDELLSAGGFYSTLYRSQFEG